MWPPSGAKRCAFETRFSSARSSRRRSPNTLLPGGAGLELDRLPALARRAGGSWPRRLSATSVGSNWRCWSRMAPVRKRARSRMSLDELLHALGVALDRLEHRPALLGRRAGGRVEEQAGARPDDGQRRPQLVGHRRQQVGAQALEVLEGGRGLAGEAGLVELQAEARQHVAARGHGARDPDEAERGELVEQPLGDAGAEVRSVGGESRLEVRERGAILDERERGEEERRTVLARPGHGRRIRPARPRQSREVPAPRRRTRSPDGERQAPRSAAAGCGDRGIARSGASALGHGSSYEQMHGPFGDAARAAERQPHVEDRPVRGSPARRSRR